MGPRAIATGGMLAVAAVWGGTYAVVKDAIALMPVGDFLTWRFALATIAVIAVSPSAVLRLSWSGVAGGVVAGLALAGGYALQTVGLVTTRASASGFITGMLVVLTPLVAAVLLREHPSRSCWFAVAIATGGLALLSLQGVAAGVGEALTLLGALAFALHIVALSRWSQHHDLHGLVVVQLATVTDASAVIAGPSALRPPPDRSVWAAVLVTRSRQPPRRTSCRPGRRPT